MSRNAAPVAELVAGLDPPAGLGEAEAHLARLRARQAELAHRRGVVRSHIGTYPGQVVDVSMSDHRRGREILDRVQAEMLELDAQIVEASARVERGHAKHVAAILTATRDADAAALADIRRGIELIMSGVTVHEQIAKAVIAAGGNQLPAPPSAQVRPRLLHALGPTLSERLVAGGKDAA